MTPKQYLKANPEQYILVTREFGDPIYIAPQKLTGCEVTIKETEAERWSSMDTTPTKLSFFRTISGFTGLTFEKI